MTERLLVDIGGTHARFARSAGRDAPQIVKVAAFPGFEDALAHAMRTGPPVDEIAIAAAGPVISGRIMLTNAPWEISAERVHRVCPGARVGIVNDLAAVALAVPGLGPGDLATLREGRAPETPEPVLCLNVGTGFGAAAAIPSGDRWIALPAEPGHMSFGPLPGEGGPAFDTVTTIEGMLSGPGLAALRTRVDEPEARAAFSRALGRVAGDLVLATGAWGGLYLCGGVMAAFDTVVDQAGFERAFLRPSGPAARLSEVPVRRILMSEPAFLGLSRLAL